MKHTHRSPQRESWRALEDLVDQGVIKALAVSNFGGRELRALLGGFPGHPLRHRPTVVQNKVDPYHVGKQARACAPHCLHLGRDETLDAPP